MLKKILLLSLISTACMAQSTGGQGVPGAGGGTVTAAAIQSALNGQTGCASVGYTYSPQSGTCVASSAVTYPTGILYGNNSTAAPTTATNSQLTGAINTAYGYTPLSPSGSASALTGLQSGQVTNALGYTPLATSGISGMTAGQIPVAASGTTVTSSKALAGAGAAIVTGPATSVSGDLPTYTGTAGQTQDSGTLLSSLVAFPSNAKVGLVAAGDSLADGATGVGVGMGLGTLLSQQPFFVGATYTNGSAGGMTCSTGANSLTGTYAANVQPYKPNGTTQTKVYLFVSDGSNDVLQSVTLANLEACYQGYVQQAVLDGFTPILHAEFIASGTTYTDAMVAELQAFNAWIRALRGTNGLPYIVADTESIIPEASSSPYFVGTTTSTPVANVTAYSVTSNVGTFTANNTLTAGQPILLWTFPSTSGSLNGTTTTVSATGLSTTSFQAPIILPNTTSTDTGAVYIPASPSFDHPGLTGNLLLAQYINNELNNLPGYTSTLGKGTFQDTWITPSNQFRFSGMLTAGPSLGTNQGVGVIMSNQSATTGLIYLGSDETDYIKRNAGVNSSAFPWLFSGTAGSNLPSVNITGAIFTGGSGTQTQPFVNIKDSSAAAVTTWSTSGTEFGINGTATANLIDAHSNGSISLFKVAPTGTVILGSTTAPTMAAGAAAGTSPTCTTVTGNNNSMVVSCTTGTATTASGTLATVTFNGTQPAAFNGCGLTPRNAVSVLTAADVYTTAPSTTTFTLAVGGTALTASTAYSWGIQCF